VTTEADPDHHAKPYSTFPGRAVPPPGHRGDTDPPAGTVIVAAAALDTDRKGYLPFGARATVMVVVRRATVRGDP